MMRTIAIVQGSRKGYVLQQNEHGRFDMRAPEKDQSKSKDRERDKNDYHVGRVEIEGSIHEIAYVSRPGYAEIVAQLHSMGLIQ
ncbi:hypothetical protein [Pectobacterium aroidearum]|uniref:hypothetical protein n=1 Tax=Pectobacterium aroidearum TaxID=1201031 RepID=UPI0032EC61D6